MVARISKQWFAIRDTYGVDIAKGEDWLLLLACACSLSTWPRIESTATIDRWMTDAALGLAVVLASSTSSY